MAIRITCPGCDTANSVSDEKSGKRIKCKSCDKAISVPDHREGIQESRNVKAKAGVHGRKKRDDDDDDDDRPAKKKPKKGAPVLLIVGGLTVVVLLLCVIGVGGTGAYFFFWAKAGVQNLTKDLGQELADAQAKQQAEMEKINKLFENKNDPFGKKNDPNPLDRPRVDVLLKIDPTPQPNTNPGPKVDPTPQPNTNPGPKIDPTPQPNTNPGPKIDPTPQPNTNPGPKVDPTPQPKINPKPTVDPRPRPRIDPLPPLDASLQRNPANLTINLATPKERSAKLISTWTELPAPPQKDTLAEKIEVDMLESLSPHPQGGTLRTTYGNSGWVYEISGHPVPRDLQTQMNFKQIAPIFVVDRAGALKERVEKKMGVLPKTIKNLLSDADWQLHTSLEIAWLPLPNRPVNPQESWPATIPITLRKKKKYEDVDLVLTCTYEGTRLVNNRAEAIITVLGKANSKNPAADQIAGAVAGRVAFDLQDGFITTAKVKVHYDYQTPSLVTYVLDVNLARVAGNPSNINDPTDPLAKNDPNPKIDPKADPNGKIIFQQPGVLTGFDFADPTQKFPPPPKLDKFGKPPAGFKPPAIQRIKIVQLPMQAGKKYTISLTTQSFSSSLRLETPFGQPAGQPSNAMGNNSQLEFTPQQQGFYRIICGCRDGQLGQFQLTVAEQ